MKRGARNSLLIVGLLVVIIILLMNPRVIRLPSRRPHQPIIVNSLPDVRRQPEFRNAPIKKYKPGRTQQMGILIGNDEEALPLYGKEVRNRRDRYHYYTTTPGNQIYPLPLVHNGRECTEDIRCPEFYGGESVSVVSKDGTYQTKMYRTDNFF